MPAAALAISALNVALFGSLLSINVHLQGTSWAPATGGEVPPNAVIAGYEVSGEQLYICKAPHKNGIHVGKVRKEFKGCNIPYGGQEISKPSYDVLIEHKWP